MDPNGVTPLAGSLALGTDVPTTLTLIVEVDGTVRAMRFPGLSQDHTVALLGLAPNTTHTVTARVTDASGNRAGSQVVAVTQPLPADFPQITVTASDPQRMEPGFLLLDRFRRNQGEPGLQYSMILDANGDVVWYSTLGANVMLARDDGRLLYRNAGGKREIDLLGAVDTVGLQDPGSGLHHDFFPSPTGTFLSLSRESVFIEDFPTSETDPDAPPEDATVQDNPVVEFDAAGNLLNVWRMSDMLDTGRIGYGSLLPSGTGFDWAHANSVVDLPDDGAILVSLRHQDAVVKFDRATGVPIWLLAPHVNWSGPFLPYLLTPVGTPFEWTYHQHSAMQTPHGTILLFDNGNFRASPFDGDAPLADDETYSRAVEYLVDEDAMTIAQVWEWQRPFGNRLYSPTGGDADWMPVTGNVLVTFMGPTYDGGLPVPREARILEITHQTPAEVVFSVTLSNAPGRITVHRSEKIPGLYAPDVGICGNGALELSEQCDPPGPAGSRRVCLPDCRLDEDGDGIADDDDSCPLAPNPGGGSAIFGQTVLFLPGVLVWDHALDYVVASGPFATTGEIGAYPVDVTTIGSGSTWIDPTAQPGAGRWYLLRPDCVDASWVSGGMSESGDRDGSLP